LIDNNIRQSIMTECMEVLCDYCKKNGIIAVQYKTVPWFYHRYPAEEDEYSLFCYGASVASQSFFNL